MLKGINGEFNYRATELNLFGKRKLCLAFRSHEQTYFVLEERHTSREGDTSNHVGNSDWGLISS